MHLFFFLIKKYCLLERIGTLEVDKLLRNLYASKEATVRTGQGTTDWFQIGKGGRQDCMLSPSYLTYMQSTS